MEELQVKLNTLCSLLPQQVPFVADQVSKAVTIAENSPNYERNLDVAIKVAQQVTKFSKGDVLYNYTPILLALLRDAGEVDLGAFDTLDHAVPIGVATIKNFLDTYATATKRAAEFIVGNKDNDNLIMVTLAFLLADIADGKNVLNIAYIMNNVNGCNIQFVNGTFQFYCDLLTAIAQSEF